MPPRSRRHPRSSASQLPASRLPLGTHLPGSPSDDPRNSSRNTNRSASGLSHYALSSDFDSETEAHPLPPPTSAPAADNMSFSSDSQMPVSVAEAKLRRQQQRIELAEAALNPPSHAQRATSRTKDKAVKMDINWDTRDRESHPVEPDLRLPVAEVRVNTYHPHNPSRVPSLSRSMSGISEQTDSADMSRQDSLLDGGYQVFQRGRMRKREELSATEGNKPEEKQKTVEAEYDIREIYEVFAAPLPSLDFIASNAGHREGQLQFIQHPNGDVSAHMWSTVRFQWDNIGSFSNIHKKIQGQIANERLKGETAWQAVQRNTLAYFRTIAKQRESNHVGAIFGQEQILELLPLPEETGYPLPQKKDDAATSRASSLAPSSVGAPDYAAQGSRQAHSNAFQFPSIAKPPSKSDDPFTTAGTPAAAYGASRLGPYASAGLPTSSNASSVDGNSMKAPVGRLAPSASVVPKMPLFRSEQSTQPSTYAPASTPIVSGGIPGIFIPAITQTKTNEDREESVLRSLKTPPRLKPVIPLTSREAMREQLFKIGATAKERSLSQANIRTGLNDPLHTQTEKTESSTNHTALVRIASPTESAGVPSSESDQKSRGTWPGSQPFWPAASLNFAQNGAKAYEVPRSTEDSDLQQQKDEELHNWWTSGNKLARQEEFYQSIVALSKANNSSSATPSRSRTTPTARPHPPTHDGTLVKSSAPPFNEGLTRVLIPVYENLASYVQGPKRHDYWSNWSQAPEYAIDRSATGNNSFFEEEWGKPPARIGRDPRYARQHPAFAGGAYGMVGASPGSSHSNYGGGYTPGGGRFGGRY